MSRSTSQRPIRIALVTTELSVGGAERCLTDLALGLDRDRFEPHVYSLAPPPLADRSALVQRLREGGVPTDYVGVRSNRQFFTAIRRLAERLRRQSPTLMQTFLFHANVIGSLAARRTNIAHRVMGVRVADPTRWRARIERRLARRVDKIVCVSESVAEHCRQMRYDPQKLQVIPNGIDTMRYPAPQPADLTSLGVPAGRRVAAFVGRLERQKGLDWLLELLPRFFQSVPDGHLLVVGDGPDRSDLERTIAARGIQDHVTFAGWRSDVPALLAASYCLVLPSRWEGMPNVLAEAMASGLPVVATRADGVLELLGPLAADQTAEMGDGDKILSLMVATFNDADSPSRLGAENRRRVVERFSLEGMVRAYELLFTAIMGG